MWRLFNGRLGSGETARVFPLSNWTEKDVWRYILREQIEIVPLYLAAPSLTFQRNGHIFVRDDDRMALLADDVLIERRVRFPTLGCWPITAAELSDATTLVEVVQETLTASHSERAGRLIDHDEAGAMEKKKQEGYF